MNNETTIAIAIGKNRHETRWQNKNLPWGEFVESLRTTTRTRESIAEYLKTAKQRQVEIKDVGGFVLGYLQNGRRKAGSVECRSALTLDLDFVGPEFWDDFTMLYSNAALIYSTHKHTPSSPRLRLIMPLSREVFPDEYTAIARKIAGTVGIDAFDDTTFQPERLMFWPSTSCDGEYVFEVQDGDWLDADAVLATYRDWRDSSAWPVSSRVMEAVQRGSTKQGDPLAKPGTIGAFCREYDIHTAIELFLSDRYSATDTDPDRYTFTHGTTAGGLVTYENKFAYSHHGTDPVSGKLVNAFDLVRIHLFGDKDENAKADLSPSKRPSFLEMEAFALSDKGVRRRMAEEKLEAAKADFLQDEDVAQESTEEPDTEWLGELEQNKKGECEATINNACLILRNDPRLKGVFALDQFAKRVVATKDLPWRKVTPFTADVVDTDDAALRHYLERKYFMRSRQAIQDAFDIVAAENAFHPVREYLDSLKGKWDGVQRIDTLLVDYLGAVDSIYTREISRVFCLGAVARIYQPGVKFDYSLTLVGAQGKGKSTFLARLGGRWFSDSFSLNGKEAYESIQGVWIIEVGELAGLKKADVEQVKHFLTKQVDSFRAAYARRSETHYRQCIFAGTTNDFTFLKDPTGARRFWPVDVHVNTPSKSVWEELKGEEVRQIWAEAVHLYEDKTPLRLSAQAEALATESQEEHSEIDARKGLLEEYLEIPIPANWESMDNFERYSYVKGGDYDLTGTRRGRVCVLDVWVELYGNKPADIERSDSMTINHMLRSLKGWQEIRYRSPEFGWQRGYTRSLEGKQRAK